jgi:curli biogenesis system outer membrane secretion channel CsgG
MTRSRLIGALVIGVVRVTLATAALAQPADARPSVAIADVAITPGSWTLPPPQMSGAIVELMLGELETSQRFHLYDGQWLVPETEAGGPLDVARLRTAAAERHVDYLVLGRLTGFSTEHKKKGFGGAVPLPFLLGGFSRNEALLRVTLAFRIVDVSTGEIIASGSGEGIGRRRSSGGGGLAIIHGIPVGAIAGAARAHSARDAMLEEALRMAVHNAALELGQRSLPYTRH